MQSCSPYELQQVDMLTGGTEFDTDSASMKIVKQFHLVIMFLYFSCCHYNALMLFPQSHFNTNTCSQLPLVVTAETGGNVWIAIPLKD